MKNYSISEEVKKVAEKVIKEQKMVYLSNVNIEYLTVSPNISNTIVGKCIKASNEMKFFTKKDFIIEVSEEIWETLDEQTREILIFHELLHISLKTNKKGEVIYGITDHNVTEFDKIIKLYGIDWFEKIKASVSSIYDMDPSEEKNIRV